jgi:hypothetical protein
LQYWDLNWGPSPWATPLALFLWGFFQYRVLQTIWLGWLRTGNRPDLCLLSSQDYRHETHWLLACFSFFKWTSSQSYYTSLHTMISLKYIFRGEISGCAHARFHFYHILPEHPPKRSLCSSGELLFLWC